MFLNTGKAKLLCILVYFLLQAGKSLSSLVGLEVMDAVDCMLCRDLSLMNPLKYGFQAEVIISEGF